MHEKHIEYHTDLLSFGYNETSGTTKEYALHCHNFYELYFFIAGDVDYIVEGKYYKPAQNSLLLLAPHAFHGVKINSNAPYIRYTLHFYPELLLPERRSFLLCTLPQGDREHWGNIYYENVDFFSLPIYFQNLKDCLSLGGTACKMLFPLYTEAILSRILVMQNAKEEIPPLAQNHTVTDILFYLNTHLTEPVTLDFLADRFFVSKHHMNKLFRKSTGTTVMDYLLRKRIANAQQLLYNGYSAKEAALQSGFHDYSNFYRSYLHMTGHAPSTDCNFRNSETEKNRPFS